VIPAAKISGMLVIKIAVELMPLLICAMCQIVRGIEIENDRLRCFVTEFQDKIDDQSANRF